MTKSELIERLVSKFPELSVSATEFSVKELLDQMSESLANNDRIEVRGFGSFSLHHRSPRVARNPKTGEKVTLADKYVPHFKPGKELRDRVNNV